jgi:Na+-driven multidrug efflux pump
MFNIGGLVSNAVNAAGSSMVGQNIGAGNFDRVPKILRSAFSIVGSIALVLSALVVFFPNQVFGIFTNDPEVMVLAMEYIPIAVLLFFGCACRDTMYALTNGSGNTKINFVCAILDGLILRISLSLFFGLYLGMEYRGFWLGDALSGFTPTVISLIFYFSGKWKKHDLLD